MKKNRIFVVCPGGVNSGGPELLHQLVHELREEGLDAYISYYPFDLLFSVPVAYEAYNVIQSVPDVDDDEILVLPESATRLIYRYRRMKIAIWWQSVDNFYQIPPQRGWRRFVPRKLASVMARASLDDLRRHMHFVQSEYARRHLAGHGIEAKMLGDYLSNIHVNTFDLSRLNAIAYNPRKDLKVAPRLIDCLPSVKFIPIQGMTAAEVHILLSTVKIYIDFGNHPGKDRMPREAAIAGACVITGLRGAAENPIDIPILQKYKLKDDELLVEKFTNLIHQIFDNFSEMALDFNDYRKKIEGERQEFSWQCKKFVEKILIKE